MQPLRHIRKVLDITTEELAKKSGLSLSAISLIENSKREAGSQTKSAIVKAVRGMINKSTLFSRELI